MPVGVNAPAGVEIRTSVETTVLITEDAELQAWNAYSLRGAPEHDLRTGRGTRGDCQRIRSDQTGHTRVRAGLDLRIRSQRLAGGIRREGESVTRRPVGCLKRDVSKTGRGIRGDVVQFGSRRRVSAIEQSAEIGSHFFQASFRAVERARFLSRSSGKLLAGRNQNEKSHEQTGKQHQYKKRGDKRHTRIAFSRFIVRFHVADSHYWYLLK